MDTKHRKTRRRQKGGISVSGIVGRASRTKTFKRLGEIYNNRSDWGIESTAKSLGSVPTIVGDVAKSAYNSGYNIGIDRAVEKTNNFIDRHESLKNIKFAAKEGISSLKNAAKFAANFDTKYITASLKTFVNAADVDRVIVKNQGFMAFIDFEQIKQMYKYEYNKDVMLYHVKGTQFFDGIYVYEKKYLEKYLKEQREKKENVVVDAKPLESDTAEQGPPKMLRKHKNNWRIKPKMRMRISRLLNVGQCLRGLIHCH